MHEWSFDEELFEKLLDQLGPTEQSASREYEKIRVRLIRYFKWRWFTNAEDLADETMNRVTKALGNGKAIWTKNPICFFYGFARNIAREERGKIPAVSLELIGERDRHLFRSDAPSEPEEPLDGNSSHLRNVYANYRSMNATCSSGTTSVKRAQRSRSERNWPVNLESVWKLFGSAPIEWNETGSQRCEMRRSEAGLITKSQVCGWKESYGQGS